MTNILNWIAIECSMHLLKFVNLLNFKQNYYIIGRDNYIMACVCVYLQKWGQWDVTHENNVWVETPCTFVKISNESEKW